MNSHSLTAFAPSVALPVSTGSQSSAVLRRVGTSFPRASSTGFRVSPLSPRGRARMSTAPAAGVGSPATPLKEGDRVPDVLFKTRERIPELEGKTDNPFDWVDKRSADYFAGKRVVLFALPGAFTPTCSATHLPGYEADYEAISACGVDAVYCLSVNDAFVMRQWGIAQKADKVTLVPDGAAAFTTAMGMGCDWTTERGFGLRSWRYSMVVNDGVIEKMFVEPDFVQNSGPDPFVVSDSKTMLKYLQSK